MIDRDDCTETCTQSETVAEEVSAAADALKPKNVALKRALERVKRDAELQLHAAHHVSHSSHSSHNTCIIV